MLDIAVSEEPQTSAIATILPREAYLSQAIYEEEMRKIFCRQWLLVGHVSSIRSPGEYFVKQVGPESLIIARDSNGEIRAYFNVCRHRGSRILPVEAQGSCNGFVCPYHKWSFSLEGELKRVPGTRDGQDFEFSDWPLHEARIAEYHGWLLVWLGSEDPVPVEQQAGALATPENLERAGSKQLKLAHSETYIVNANWKSMLENNAECYHCAFGGHPSLAVACDHLAFASDHQNGQHFPLRKGMETFSMDGTRVSTKTLGNLPEEPFSTGFIIMPMFAGPVLFVDHAVSLELTPLSVDKTQLICEWYVHEDAVEGEHYEIEKLIEVFHVTNLEDGHFAEENYRGITSLRFSPGPLHPRREWGVIGALNLYREMMAAD